MYPWIKDSSNKVTKPVQYKMCILINVPLQQLDILNGSYR